MILNLASFPFIGAQKGSKTRLARDRYQGRSLTGVFKLCFTPSSMLDRTLIYPHLLLNHALSESTLHDITNDLEH